MAETLISPGVLARENDQSQVTQGPIEAGAAIIGPTVKGPVGIPTVVTSYSDYTNKFGATLVSGGATYSYLTSVAAYNYFTNGGNSLLVTRVVTGSFTPASSSQINNTINATAGAFATGSYNSFAASSTGSYRAVALQINDNTYYFAGADFEVKNSALDYYYFNVATGDTNWTLNTWGTQLANAINNFDTNRYVTATWNTNTLILSSSAPGTGNGIQLLVAGYVGLQTSSMANGVVLSGATTNVAANAFVLETLTQGADQNSTSTELAGGVLPSGSADNIRWQIAGVNTGSGTFNLIIRRGNDNTNNPAVVETWNNLSLDPFAPNYIEAVIGNQAYSVNTDDSTYYVQTTGTYTNKSRYVRVKAVNYPTPNYLNSNGAINSASDGTSFTRYIPTAISGTFGSATGTNFVGGAAFYNSTTTATNIQGIPAANYNTSITLLGNQDDYKFNILSAPGLTTVNAPSQVSSIVSTCQNRGDAIAVIDVAAYGSTVGTVVNNAAAYNNSYAATYWPWLQTIDPGTGKAVFVPASTMIPGVYAYNDSVAEPWFAPAGINRGGLGTVVQAERRLAQTDRDTLYIANVNPIATFPGTGVVVYGQKTLQKAASALDRINVRRLLIALKGYISQVANNLVFEQNSIATRNNFLAQVNPYLQSVQQRQGLYAFKVVMDDSNNTPDVIDRNQLVGQIYLQPTKTAEFILLDFNILPTGATFE